MPSRLQNFPLVQSPLSSSISPNPILPISFSGPTPLIAYGAGFLFGLNLILLCGLWVWSWDLPLHALQVQALENRLEEWTVSEVSAPFEPTPPVSVWGAFLAGAVLGGVSVLCLFYVR